MQCFLMIDELIASEFQYFLPMLERQKELSEASQAVWRAETVSERRLRVSLEVYDLCDGTVRYGPFSGVRLTKQVWWGAGDLGSQCLGLYEKEILDSIEQSGKNYFDYFIDIGAADGYYAVGMLASGFVQNAICFERSKEGQNTILNNWQNNGSVGNLVVLGEANQESLETLPSRSFGRSFVLIDIEGHEFELLNSRVIQLLKHCHVIIEIHNWVNDFFIKYTELLRSLAESFKVTVLERVERPTLGFEELRSFTDDNRLLLTSERRPCVMRFLRLKPRD